MGASPPAQPSMQGNWGIYTLIPKSLGGGLLLWPAIRVDGYLAGLKKSPQARDAEADGRNVMEHTKMSKGYCVCA